MPTVSSGLYCSLFRRGASLEDFADRLNHFWTFGLLLLLSCILSWTQLYGYPIQCWSPAEMTEQMTKYINSICWNSFTVYEPMNNDIPGWSFDKPQAKVTVYQYLPLILCFQALLFKLPNIIMYVFHNYSGTSFDKLAGLTKGYEIMAIKQRELLGEQVGRYFHCWCNLLKGLPWRLLTLIWLIVKILYCTNIVLQLKVLDSFLSPRNPPYDNTTSYAEIIAGNIKETTVKFSQILPRVILCDLNIRQFTHIHAYTVQCFLPSNQICEFIYMFIWVWFLIVAIVTWLSLAEWIVKTLVPIFRKRYITKALSLAQDIDPRALTPNDLDKFCNFIGEDGVMALKIVAANSSEILVSHVVCSIWKLESGVTGDRMAGYISHGSGPVVMLDTRTQTQPSAPTIADTPEWQVQQQ